MRRTFSTLVLGSIISGCVVGGHTTDCLLDADCGDNHRCNNGACEETSPPSMPDPMDMSIELPTSTPTQLSVTTDEAAAFLIGEWEIRDRRGQPVFFNNDIDGVLFLIDGFWFSLGRNVHGELITLRTDGHSGEWRLRSDGTIVIPYEDERHYYQERLLRYAFTDNPRTITVTVSDDSGSVTMTPVGSSALACEKIRTPILWRHPACGYSEPPCWCPNDRGGASTNGVGTCLPDGNVDCVCGIPALDDLHAGMIGSWTGLRRRANEEPIEVGFDFTGVYFKATCLEGCGCEAIDWVRDQRGEYRVWELHEDGSASGTFEIHKWSSWLGGTSVDQVRLSEDRNHLTFDVLGYDDEPTNSFELVRAEPAEPIVAPSCWNNAASCACGAPTCCDPGDDRPFVCLSCPEDRCGP